MAKQREQARRPHPEPSTTLLGELLECPTPSKAGFWVYRKLKDGTVLETELTSEEWLALRTKGKEAKEDERRQQAKQACEQICRKLIYAFRKMKPLLLGDDTPLANAWDDICVQEQQERAFMWDESYGVSLMGFLEGELESLDEDTRRSIWLRTEDGIIWSVEGDITPDESSNEKVAEYILNQYVLPAAESYSNKRIRSVVERKEER